MSSFIIAFWITAVFFLIRSAFATFREDMRNDDNVWLMVICIGIVIFLLAVDPDVIMRR